MRRSKRLFEGWEISGAIPFQCCNGSRRAGLVTAGNLGEFLAIQTAFKSCNGRAPSTKMTHGLEGQTS